MGIYVKSSACISARNTFGETDLSEYSLQSEKLIAREPVYSMIAPAVLRRMGKAIRMTCGAVSQLDLKNNPIKGIIIGTANGGMEDCIRFLNQIVQYDEGTLTPTNFVQSTPNAIASTIGMNLQCRGYNITHVHRGNAFENALLDAFMYLDENKNASLLLGGIDEISDYNYNIERLGGWYKTEIPANGLYESKTEGSIAGEGCAVFCLSNRPQNALFEIVDVNTMHSTDVDSVQSGIKQFCDKHALNLSETMLLSGHNGDVRNEALHQAVENLFDKSTVIRYKHFFGEFPTVSALTLWLIGQIATSDVVLPGHFYLRKSKTKIKNYLIWNHYKGYQHGFILSKPCQ
ncbi:MAG TPA: beta-ketoacyl synthase chain length factor [Bacteroidia bacterium]|jgi:hypothetical protein|nr:beta-ketoacyl synthase chain length factor [Bacteroidia bacterium]HMU19754.1 beta-ketoacyl synthase chain length factor [Bacteroidia bacterium]